MNVSTKKKFKFKYIKDKTRDVGAWPIRQIKSQNSSASATSVSSIFHLLSASCLIRMSINCFSHCSGTKLEVVWCWLQPRRKEVRAEGCFEKVTAARVNRAKTLKAFEKQSKNPWHHHPEVKSEGSVETSQWDVTCCPRWWTRSLTIHSDGVVTSPLRL